MWLRHLPNHLLGQQHVLPLHVPPTLDHCLHLTTPIPHHYEHIPPKFFNFQPISVTPNLIHVIGEKSVNQIVGGVYDDVLAEHAGIAACASGEEGFL